MTTNNNTQGKETFKNNTQEKETFKSGFIVILGRPNSGKSTLVNTLVGEKVSIVSWKPQTTRDKILGVYNDKDTQIIFIDTPGLHSPKNTLGRYMMRSAKVALDGVDAVVYLVDGEKGLSANDNKSIMYYLKNNYNTIIAINKVDCIDRKKVFDILTELKEFPNLKAIIPISATKARNTDVLLTEIKKLLSDNIKYYPDDIFTDKNIRFMVTEIIREKALRLLEQEIPHGVGVIVTKFEYSKGGKLLNIDADILCEKPSHRPIILGKGGSMIKKIATYARQDTETLIGVKVFLTVFVKVKENWRSNEAVLKELGYT